MPRYGLKWRYSDSELAKALRWLIAHCPDLRVRLVHITRCALAISGRASTARVLRERLLAIGALIADTKAGRQSDYVIVPSALAQLHEEPGT